MGLMRPMSPMWFTLVSLHSSLFKSYPIRFEMRSAPLRIFSPIPGIISGVTRISGPVTQIDATGNPVLSKTVEPTQ
jgi:hypothetical protein